MTPPASPPRVLVAEDHPVARRVAAAMLSELGCLVETVTTGPAAVEACAPGRYALVLMDCELPGIDGYEATRRIRAAEQGRRTPVVALSAHSGPEHRRRSREAGMDDHIVKPFSLKALRGVLERWAGQAFPAAAAADTLEPGVLEDLRSISPRIAAETVAQFLKSAPRALAVLGEAVRAGDADGAARAAHGFAGSAGLVGARRLHAVCRALEGAARKGRLDAGQADEIGREFARVRAALERGFSPAAADPRRGR